MKKVLLAWLLIFALVVTACSGATETTETTESTETETVDTSADVEQAEAEKKAAEEAAAQAQAELDAAKAAEEQAKADAEKAAAEKAEAERLLAEANTAIEKAAAEKVLADTVAAEQAAAAALAKATAEIAAAQKAAAQKAAAQKAAAEKAAAQKAAAQKAAAEKTATQKPVETKTQPPVTIKYVIPGTEPVSWQEVKAAVNKKLLEDGVNVQIEIQRYDWSVWDQKINLMLSTGEDFDLFHIMNNLVTHANFIGRGAVKDIGAELDKYGENIKKVIPADVMDAVKKNGKVYGIPAHWMESSVVGVFTTNDFLTKKYNVSSQPKTLQEMADAIEKAYKASPEPKIIYPLRTEEIPVDFMHRTFDSYPFDVRDKVAMITKEGKVRNWIETEEFKASSAWLRQLYLKKLINPDILTLGAAEQRTAGGSGNWLFNMGTIGTQESELQKTIPGITKNDFSLNMLNPEKGTYRFINAKNLNAVPSHSKKPAEAVKFLNWLYANQDNYDLFMYGIEGKTYKKVGEQGIEIMFNDQKRSLIPNSDWMIGNLNYIRTDVNALPATLKLFKPDPKAKSFITSGFFFDASSVKTEFSNIQAIATSDILPIYVGVIDFETNIQAVIGKLKAAGIDKVLAEYQKQLDEYLKSK